jgi:ribonuclease Z
VIFSVTILGSGSAVPTPSRFPTAQFVSCNNRNILIDCGEGTQFQMRKYGVKIQSLQVILISHLHGDHFFGLVGLISTMHLLGRNSGLTIVGPKGLEEIIRSQLEIGHRKLDFEIEFKLLGKGEISSVYEDKLIEIQTFPLNHKVPTHGYLIKEKPAELNLKKQKVLDFQIPLAVIHQLKAGKDVLDEQGRYWKFKEFTLPPKKLLSYAYCSDTKFDERIIEYITGSTVLYHEATFIEKDKIRATKTFHSTAKEAATIALKSNVQKLVMGHISARYSNELEHVKEAKHIFDNTTFAYDGMIIEIGE